NLFDDVSSNSGSEADEASQLSSEKLDLTSAAHEAKKDDENSEFELSFGDYFGSENPEGGFSLQNLSDNKRADSHDQSEAVKDEETSKIENEKLAEKNDSAAHDPFSLASLNEEPDPGAEKSNDLSGPIIKAFDASPGEGSKPEKIAD